MPTALLNLASGLVSALERAEPLIARLNRRPIDLFALRRRPLLARLSNYDRAFVIFGAFGLSALGAPLAAALAWGLAFALPRLHSLAETIRAPAARFRGRERAIDIWNDAQGAAALLVHAWLAAFLAGVFAPLLP